MIKINFKAIKVDQISKTSKFDYIIYKFYSIFPIMPIKKFHRKLSGFNVEDCVKRAIKNKNKFIHK
jgi:hypothetical protein